VNGSKHFEKNTVSTNCNETVDLTVR